jgi:hypothetical protein
MTTRPRRLGLRGGGCVGWGVAMRTGSMAREEVAADHRHQEPGPLPRGGLRLDRPCLAYTAALLGSVSQHRSSRQWYSQDTPEDRTVGKGRCSHTLCGPMPKGLEQVVTTGESLHRSMGYSIRHVWQEVYPRPSARCTRRYYLSPPDQASTATSTTMAGRAGECAKGDMGRK